MRNRLKAKFRSVDQMMDAVVHNYKPHEKPGEGR
jgi:hypothetical protein